MTPAAPHQDPRFGLLQATALNMTNMLGAGPFITIPLFMAAMGGPQSMLGWAMALLITMADGLVWAELGSALPSAGGTYGFFRAAFSPWLRRFMCFLFVWQLVISGPMEIASALIGIRPYLSYLWPALTEGQTQGISVCVALLIVWLLYRPIGSVARLTLALWLGVLLTVAAVIGCGALNFDAKLAFDFPADWWQPQQGWAFWSGFLWGLGSATSTGIYDYLGYYDVCYIGSEVKEPGRTVPRAVLLSLLAVAAIYVGIHLSFLGTLPWREFVGKEGYAIASYFMERLHGHGAAVMLTLLIVWTTYAGVFALMLGYSRVPYAAAQEGDFFSAFTQQHPRGGFPTLSLLIIGGLSIAFSFWNLGIVISTLVTLRIAVQFIGQIFALVWLRRHRTDLQRPFRMWLYPLPCCIAFSGWVFLLITAGSQQLLYAAVALMIGGLGFMIWDRSHAQPA
jgi:amino acid transporter